MKVTKTGTVKQITIIEIDYHPEVLRNLIELLVSHGYKLHIFTLTDIREKASLKIKSENIHIYQENKKSKIKRLIKNNLAFFKHRFTNLLIPDHFHPQLCCAD